MTKPSPAAAAAAPPPASSSDEGERKSINQELWQACAGPLVNLPAAGTHVVYFPQGHSEQVAASMKKDVDGQIPNYPNLSSQLLCVLHNVMLHADPETDEVYAQMTLQPVPSFDKEALLMSDLSLKVNKPQTEFFCKTLTPSDTSTHGGFSVPRRAAEKIFPPLDFSMQPPAQELTATDLHGIVWTFRHVYRGQPKRHLLTTGWSHFVGVKRLIAGDSVLFIRDEKQNLLVGLRRANRQPTNLSYSMLSSDSMHIGVLAAAAHAAANNSPFAVFFNPRASPSEFVIPFAKYYRAAYNQQISLGMRFRMLFETEESGTRRYMGTITSISDLDPVRWKNSQWRNLQVGWDESTGGERRKRVSAWEIEPVTAPFFIHPPFFGAKHPRQPDVDPSEFGNLFKRNMPWLGDDIYIKEPQAFNGFTLAQQANMRQNPSLAFNGFTLAQQANMQTNLLNPSPGFSLQGLPSADISHQLGFTTPQLTQQNNMQFNVPRHMQPAKQPDQLQSSSGAGSSLQPQQQLPDISQTRQHLVNQTLMPGQVPSQILQSLTTVHMQNTLQSTSPLQNSQHQGSIDQSPLQQQQQQPIFDESWRNSLVASQLPKQCNQLSQVTSNQAQLELLQKFEHHQQSQVSQQSTFQQPSQLTQIQGPQKLNVSQSFCTSVAPSPVGVMQQLQATNQSQSQILAHQINRNSGENNLVFTNLLQMQKVQQQQPCMVSDVQGHVGFSSNSVTDHPPILRGCNFTEAAAAQSASTGAALTGSTPSTNNIPDVVQTVVNMGPRSSNVSDLMAQSSAIVLNTSGLDTAVTNGNSCTNNIPSIVQTAVNMGPLSNNVGDGLTRSLAMPLNANGVETMATNGNSFKDFHQKSDIRPSVNVSKPQNQESFEQQAYENVPGSHLDYLDTSSATSVSPSQGTAHLERNNSVSFNSQANFLRDRSQCNEVQAEPGNRNIDSQLTKTVASESLLTKSMMGSVRDFSNFSLGGFLTNYENCNDAQQELSSSMVTQSFGVPDVAFNSIDSAMNESQFPNQGAWAPPPQYQRMRTYTKVYKRGAVGRSVDVTRYSGYEELKQDLARRFGIEGQLEDKVRVGWKLVYVDHENDVLLVGDDPWEEFIGCVRCIKILSPQEVQQMSLDGEYTNPSLPNQACSSSDGGNL